MKLGFFTMPLHPPGSFQADILEEDLQQVEKLDQWGYHEAWFGEHFTSEWESLPAPDLFVAAAISRTRTIKLGTGVICMPSHNPFQVAHRIAILDHLARGRFYFGVGSGGYPGDFQAFGIDLGFTAALFTQCVVSVFVAIPAAPGFIGTLQAGVLVAVSGVFGVSETEALSMSVGYHLAGYIPVTLLGLYYGWTLRLRYSAIEIETEPAT